MEAVATAKELKEMAQNFKVLYAEDNDALRENATKFLKKFFTAVYPAKDGREAYEIYREYFPQIVITDIKMPHLSGLELSALIHKENPQVKIILMTAFDSKEYLYKSIELGVFRYLKKPVTLSQFTQTLKESVLDLIHTKELELFHEYMRSIFDYQSSLIVMFKEGKITLVNQAFEKFFEVEGVKEFLLRYEDLGNVLLEHDGFLYNQKGIYWFDLISHNAEKLYHAKIKNAQGEVRHFFLKYQKVPEDPSLGILSFDDVTELNLLQLFDEKQTKSDLLEQDSKAIANLLEAVNRNGAQVQLYNYYKGLSITNNAFVVDSGHDLITLKTNMTQQKAIRFEQKTLILSDVFPFPLECNKVISNSFEKQSVVLRDLRFVLHSAVERETIRLIPEDKHTVSLFVKDSKYHGATRIEDISLRGVRLRVDALPPGLELESEALVDMVLELDKAPLIVNTKVKLISKIDNRHSFSLVFLLDLKDEMRAKLLKYMTKRQMAIIREFKGL